MIPSINGIIGIPPNPTHTCKTLNLLHMQGVAKLLSNSKPNKASDPDKIAARFLKEMANVLAPSLTLIFKASLALPEDWKKAFVIPVYKEVIDLVLQIIGPSPLPAYHAK